MLKCHKGISNDAKINFETYIKKFYTSKTIIKIFMLRPMSKYAKFWNIDYLTDIQTPLVIHSYFILSGSQKIQKNVWYKRFFGKNGTWETQIFQSSQNLN